MENQNENKQEKKLEKFTGFIGKDAQIKELPNQSKVVNLDLGQSGKDNEPAQWVRTAFWNDLAQHAQDLKKGQKITVEGEKKSNTSKKDDKIYTNEYIEVRTFSIHNQKEITGQLASVPLEKKINNSDALEFNVIDKNNQEQKVVIFKSSDESKNYNFNKGDNFSYKGEEKVSFYKNKEGELKQSSTFIGKENLLEQNIEKKTDKKKSKDLSV